MDNNLGFKLRKIKPLPQDKKEKKKKKRKIFPIILAVLLIIFLIIGVGSYILIRVLAKKISQNIEEELGKTDPSGWQKEWQNIANEMKNETDNLKDLEEKRGKIGETLSDGEVSIALNSIAREEKIEGEKARDSYEFIALDLSVTNQKYEDIMFYNSNFILRDSRYTEYNIKTMEAGDLNLLKGMQNIFAQEGIGGNIIYEVKKDVGSLEFLYLGQKKLIFEIEKL